MSATEAPMIAGAATPLVWAIVASDGRILHTVGGGQARAEVLLSECANHGHGEGAKVVPLFRGLNAAHEDVVKASVAAAHAEHLETLKNALKDAEWKAVDAVAAAVAAERDRVAAFDVAAYRARLEYWLDLWKHRVQKPEYPGDEATSNAKIEAYEQAILALDEAAKVTP